jgi:hypothetical protein
MAVRDYNGDGRSDVLWYDFSNGKSLWLASASGDFTIAPGFASRTLSNVEARGDFNADGRSDLLLRDIDTHAVSILFGTADAQFSAPVSAGLSAPFPGGWSAIAAGDFNGDGRDDMLWSNFNEPLKGLTVWLANSSGTFTVSTTNNQGSFPSRIFILDATDTNYDGRDDVLWIDLTNRVVGSWLASPTGGFAPGQPQAYGFSDRWNYQGLGDFNGDGRDDLLFRDTDSAATNIWWGNAAGAYSLNAASGNVVGSGWSFADTGDYNGDGRSDILWRHSSGLMSEWLGQADGSMIVQNLAATPTSDWYIL